MEHAMPKFSDKGQADWEKFSKPQSDHNDYFVSKADWERTRSAIYSLADKNAGKGRVNQEVKTEKNYTTFLVALQGNEILSITCKQKASVRLTGGDKAWH